MLDLHLRDWARDTRDGAVGRVVAMQRRLTPRYECSALLLIGVGGGLFAERWVPEADLQLATRDSMTGREA